jgi:hypothetical protein
MELREVAVNELTFGVYVSRLDRPWTETPLYFQGFVLKSDKQLDVLKKLLQARLCRPGKGRTRRRSPRSPPRILRKIRGTTVYKEAASVEVELPKAHSAYAQTTTVVQELSRAIEIGNAIDSQRSHEAAAQITESVVRNPDAMALLVKLQEKSGETLSRAVGISVMMTIFRPISAVAGGSHPDSGHARTIAGRRQAEAARRARRTRPEQRRRKRTVSQSCQSFGTHPQRHPRPASRASRIGLTASRALRRHWLSARSARATQSQFPA